MLKFAAMSQKDKFLAEFPNGIFVELEDKAGLRQLLAGITNENLKSVEKAGEGNMNAVVRVRTESKSFIIKQARPWVEKFPQIAAPAERLAIESEYFHVMRNFENLTPYLPEILMFDEQSNVIIMEDLGDAADLTSVYHTHQLERTTLDTLIRYLVMQFSVAVPDDYPDNLQMRQLNHAHIFDLPFQKNNGFDLDAITEGLKDASQSYIENNKLTGAISTLGEMYLNPQRDFILHGDYYPGSFLNTSDGVRVIDPEFTFAGPAEWDMGVFLAHLYLAGLKPDSVEYVKNEFSNHHNVNDRLLWHFCGIEILRRTLGLAQLPITHDLKERIALMDTARDMILN